MPCPGLDKLPVLKHPAWGDAHGGVRVTFWDVEGKGTPASKPGMKCIKLRKLGRGPRGAPGCRDEKGDFKLRGHGCLQRTFTNCHLLPQGLQLEVFSWEVARGIAELGCKPVFLHAARPWKPG